MSIVPSLDSYVWEFDIYSEGSTSLSWTKQLLPNNEEVRLLLSPQGIIINMHQHNEIDFTSENAQKAYVIFGENPNLKNLPTILSLSPNPTKEEVFIRGIIGGDIALNTINLIIRDLKGVKVDDVAIEPDHGFFNYPVDIDLSNGIYIYQIIINGKTRWSNKLIIK